MMNLFDINSDEPFIRYMGGKQYACKKLASYLPEGLDEMVSPFIGGGSFELFCGANLNIRVHAYDNFPTLVRHWNIMLERAGEVMRATNKSFPLAKSLLTNLVVSEQIHDPKIFPSPDKDLALAVILMCMTRQGFNGYYTKTRYFRDKDDPVLAKFEPYDEDFWDIWQNKKVSVECQEWEITLAKHENDFFFCDPPYIGHEDYYGQYQTRKTKYKQKPFDHALLAERLAKHKNGGIITYKDNPEVWKLYDRTEFKIYRETWHQGSRASQGSEEAKELVIVKLPAMHPDERLTKPSKIGDPKGICRVYGAYYPVPDSSTTVKMTTPNTLCDFIERAFSAFNPVYPGSTSMQSLLSTVPYDRYGCTKSDVRGIIEVLLQRGIIIEKKGAHKGSIYYGYPVFEITNMNAHIKEMREQGIPVKAVPHFSYEYSEDGIN